MSDVLIASNQADAEAAEKVVSHHAEMQGRLGILVGKLEAAANAESAITSRNEIVAWCREELIPHALAEEATLYQAAAELPQLKVLVEAMISEHRVLVSQIDALEGANHPVSAIAAAGGLRTLLEVHIDKENNLVVPALVSSSAHSVADLLNQMHGALSERPEAAGAAPAAAAAAAAPATGGCACGGHDEEGLPVLDVRQVPHAIRHATIFGALDGLQSGKGLILAADHDPLPLLTQLEQRAPGAFDISYLERGPELFQLQLIRR